jgi:hypothetical protein
MGPGPDRDAVTGSNPQLPFDGAAAVPPPGPPPNAPYVYVATKITGTTPGSPERQIIEFAVATIRDALLEATTQAADDPWDVRVHAPVDWTTPDQTPGLGPSDIFAQNRSRGRPSRAWPRSSGGLAHCAGRT